MEIFFGTTVKSKSLFALDLSLPSFFALDQFTSPEALPISLSEFQALPNQDKLSFKDNLFFIPASLKKPVRHSKYVDTINFVVIDIENTPFEKVPDTFPYNYLIHSTLQHSKARPRYHCIVPTKPFPAGRYPEAVNNIAECLGLLKINSESQIPVQPMFFPKVLKNSEYFFESKLDRKPYSLNNGALKSTTAPQNAFTYYKPRLTLETNQVKDILSYLNPSMSRGNWLFVAAALRHQFADDPETGFQLFDRWSAKSEEKYGGPEDTEKLYFSLKPNPDDRKPATMASLLAIAKIKGYSLPSPSISPRPGPLARGSVATEKASSVLPGKWYSSFVYLSGPDLFYNLDTKKLFSITAFDRTFSRNLIDPDSVKIVSRPKHKPSDFCLNVIKIPVALDVCYYPTSNPDPFITIDGHLRINTYLIPEHLSGGESDPQKYDRVRRILLEHTKILLPDPEHRKIFLSYLAYCVQHPGKKISWAIILQGAPGCGKTFFYCLMSTVLGHRNTSLLTPSTLSSSWTDWAFGKQMNFIENMQDQYKGKLLEHLKPFISNEHITIDERYLKSRSEINTVNYVFFCDRHIALFLLKGERRYCYLKCAIQTPEDKELQPKGYFDELFSVLDYPAECTEFFKKYPIAKKFNPKGEAPRTRYNAELETFSEMYETTWFKEKIQDDKDPLISPDIVSSTHALTLMSLDNSFPRMPSPKSIGAALSEMRYSYQGRILIKKDNKRHSIWTGPSVKAEEIKELLKNL